MTTSRWAAALALALAVTAAPAWAQGRHDQDWRDRGDWHDRGDRHDRDRRDWDRHDRDRHDWDRRGPPREVFREHHPDWRDRDIRRFHEHDYARWRGGQWYHGPHGGRLGWWWIVGGVWYFYPQPVYPYPDPYLPPVAAPPPQAQPSYYYCESPQGYYPYIAECPTGWRVIPAR